MLVWIEKFFDWIEFLYFVLSKHFEKLVLGSSQFRQLCNFIFSIWGFNNADGLFDVVCSLNDFFCDSCDSINFVMINCSKLLCLYL